MSRTNRLKRVSVLEEQPAPEDRIDKIFVFGVEPKTGEQTDGFCIDIANDRRYPVSKGVKLHD